MNGSIEVIEDKLIKHKYEWSDATKTRLLVKDLEEFKQYLSKVGILGRAPSSILFGMRFGMSAKQLLDRFNTFRDEVRPVECPHCGVGYTYGELHLCADTQDGELKL